VSYPLASPGTRYAEAYVTEERDKLFRKGGFPSLAPQLAPSAQPGPGGSLLIRQAVVTPTRLILLPPAREISNSVLRRYPDHIDRFLRVQFNDEADQLQVR
jgi:hypothetical protein